MATNDSIGALWEKVSGKGTTFLTGNVLVDGVVVEIVCFLNNKRTDENRQPHYRIFKSRPKEDNGPSKKDLPF